MWCTIMICVWVCNIVFVFSFAAHRFLPLQAFAGYVDFHSRSNYIVLCVNVAGENKLLLFFFVCFVLWTQIQLVAVVDDVYTDHSHIAGKFTMLSSSRVYVGGSVNPRALLGARVHNNFVGCLRKVCSRCSLYNVHAYAYAWHWAGFSFVWQLCFFSV